MRLLEKEKAHWQQQQQQTMYIYLLFENFDND
jgi:hypothetical protein